MEYNIIEKKMFCDALNMICLSRALKALSSSFISWTYKRATKAELKRSINDIVWTSDNAVLQIPNCGCFSYPFNTNNEKYHTWYQSGLIFSFHGDLSDD